MTRTILTLLTLAALTACGADGPPPRPATKPGVSPVRPVSDDCSQPGSNDDAGASAFVCSF